MNNSITLSVKPYLENESEEKITLHDINKYIVFREISDERVEKEIIKQFIFYSKFYNDNIKERIKRELGFYSFKSNPIFDYDGKKHSLLINFSDEKSKKNSFKLKFKLNEEDENNETNISHINNIQEELSTLTQSEKFCFIFLALSVKTMESMKLNSNPTNLIQNNKKEIINFFPNIFANLEITYDFPDAVSPWIIQTLSPRFVEFLFNFIDSIVLTDKV